MASRKKPRPTGVVPERAAPGPIRVERDDDGARIHLEGAIGVPLARQLHAAAREVAESAGPVRIHSERLGYLDCAAVQVLLALNETLTSRGSRLTMTGVPDSVVQTLRSAGLAGAF